MENVLDRNCLFPDDYKWYAMRVTYGRELEAEALIEKKGILTYVPTHKVMKMVKGRRKKVRESMLPNLLFLFTDYLTAKKIAVNPLKSETRRKDKALVNVHFMYDRTSERKGKDGIVIIPHKEMLNFIRFTIRGNESIRVVSPEDFKIRKNQTVIVKQGEFKGVIGKVARMNRQTCIIVDFQPVCMLASAYIPKAFLEVYEP